MFIIVGIDGKEYGPVPAGKIREWIHGGRADAHTQARAETETVLRPLGEMPEFAPEFAPPAEPPPAAVADGADFPPLAEAVPETEAAPARRLTRLAAQCLDSLIGLLLALPGACFWVIGRKTHNDAFVLLGEGLIGSVLLILAVVQATLLTLRGQTLGKLILRIRIVRFVSGENPGFVRAYVVRTFVIALCGVVPVVGPFFMLVDICFIFRPDRRCIHDLLADTRVVELPRAAPPPAG